MSLLIEITQLRYLVIWLVYDQSDCISAWCKCVPRSYLYQRSVIFTGRNDGINYTNITSITISYNCVICSIFLLLLPLFFLPKKQKFIGRSKATAQVTVSGWNVNRLWTLDTDHQHADVTALVVHLFYQQMKPNLNLVSGKAWWHSRCRVPGPADCLFFFLRGTLCGIWHLLRALLFLKSLQFISSPVAFEDLHSQFWPHLCWRLRAFILNGVHFRNNKSTE